MAQVKHMPVGNRYDCGIKQSTPLWDMIDNSNSSSFNLSKKPEVSESRYNPSSSLKAQYSNQVRTRKQCSKCGCDGHFASQCLNHIRFVENDDVVEFTGSDDSTSEEISDSDSKKISLKEESSKKEKEKLKKSRRSRSRSTKREHKHKRHHHKHHKHRKRSPSHSRSESESRNENKRHKHYKHKHRKRSRSVSRYKSESRNKRHKHNHEKKRDSSKKK